MAVSFKVSPTGFFQANGLATAAGMLKEAGIAAVVTSTKLRFVKDGEVIGVFEVTKADVVEKKVLSHGQQLLLQNTIAKVVNKKVEKDQVPAPGADSLLLAEQTASEATTYIPTNSQKWGAFPEAEMASAQPVKLRDADRMYQPVSGTSGGSRYFLVAARDDLKIAARFKNGRLSVRIEGPDLAKYVGSIQQVGFDNVKTSGDKPYASMHLDIADQTVAAKALGAVITGLGIVMETPVPSLAVFANKGA